MPYTSVFLNNRTQAVRIPAHMRFDDHIKQVAIRQIGHERILSPVDSLWDSFFMGEKADADFMPERLTAPSNQRLSFD